MYSGNSISIIGFLYNALYTFDVSNKALISIFSFFTNVDKSDLFIVNFAFDTGSSILIFILPLTSSVLVFNATSLDKFETSLICDFE